MHQGFLMKWHELKSEDEPESAPTKSKSVGENQQLSVIRGRSLGPGTYSTEVPDTFLTLLEEL